MDAAAKKSGRSRADKRSPKDQTVCEALKHPVRVRILEVLCEGDISPIQFLRRGLLPPGFDFEGAHLPEQSAGFAFRPGLRVNELRGAEKDLALDFADADRQG